MMPAFNRWDMLALVVYAIDRDAMERPMLAMAEEFIEKGEGLKKT